MPDKTRHITVKRASRIGLAGAVFGEDVKRTLLAQFGAGISYALTEAMDDGHCGLPTDELMPLAENLLEVPLELVRTALDLELADGTV